MFNVSYLAIYIIVTIINALWPSLLVVCGTTMMTKPWSYDSSLLQRAIAFNEDNKMALYSPWDQAKYIREKQYIERMHHVYLGCGITYSLIGGESKVSFTKYVGNGREFQQQMPELEGAWGKGMENSENLKACQVLYKISSGDVNINFGLLMTFQQILKKLFNVFFLEGQASLARTDIITGSLSKYNWKPFTLDINVRIIVGIGKTFELPRPFIGWADWSAIFLCFTLGRPQTSSYILTRYVNSSTIKNYFEVTGTGGATLTQDDFMVLDTKGKNDILLEGENHQQLELLFNTPIAMNLGSKIIFIKDQKMFSLTVIFDFRTRYFWTKGADDDINKIFNRFEGDGYKVALNLKNSKFTYVTLWFAISWLV